MLKFYLHYIEKFLWFKTTRNFYIYFYSIYLNFMLRDINKFTWVCRLFTFFSCMTHILYYVANTKKLVSSKSINMRLDILFVIFNSYFEVCDSECKLMLDTKLPINYTHFLTFDINSATSQLLYIIYTHFWVAFIPFKTSSSAFKFTWVFSLICKS